MGLAQVKLRGVAGVDFAFVLGLVATTCCGCRCWRRRSMSRESRQPTLGVCKMRAKPPRRLAGRALGDADPRRGSYTPSPARLCWGRPEFEYPLHDRDVVVEDCGAICLHNTRVAISKVLAGQRLGLREVENDVWLVSFMDYDLGYIDLEARGLETIDNPFGARPAPGG